MTTAGRDVLVAGVSARALAQAALAAGYRPAAIDAYGDLDLRQVVGEAWIGVQPWQPHEAALAATALPTAAVAYTANLEHAPAAVAALSAGRALLGNGAATLTAVRDPAAVAGALATAGGLTPPVRRSAPRALDRSWLLKPLQGGGGHGIRAWQPGDEVPSSHYLQEQVAGVAGSLLFVADGRTAHAIGLTQQLVGDARFGARPWRWCGNILADGHTPLFDRQEQLLASATRAAQALTLAFGLRGVNGIDFIARDGQAWVVEVNPRWTGATELVARATRAATFELHRRACLAPLSHAIVHALAHRGLHGKAVVFAEHDGIARGTAAWLGERDLADIPPEGTELRQGQPICTVLASGTSADEILTTLARRAARVQSAVRADDTAPPMTITKEQQLP